VAAGVRNRLPADLLARCARSFARRERLTLTRSASRDADRPSVPRDLLLEYAFGLGYRRVEWKCAARNKRSRRAAEHLGFTFEGVQDAHYIVKAATATLRVSHRRARMARGVRQRLRGLLEVP
jgi:hypothetical protein